MNYSEPRNGNQKLEYAKALRMGSYAHNVIYSTEYGYICPICGGPKETERTLCRVCDSEKGQAAGLGLMLADTVRFSHYACMCKSDQMYRIMQGYKDDNNRQKSSTNKISSTLLRTRL